MVSYGQFYVSIDGRCADFVYQDIVNVNLDGNYRMRIRRPCNDVSRRADHRMGNGRAHGDRGICLAQWAECEGTPLSCPHCKRYQPNPYELLSMASCHYFHSKTQIFSSRSDVPEIPKNCANRKFRER